MPRVEYVPVDEGSAGAHRDEVLAIAEALRTARDDAGLTQQELGDRVGLGQPAIQKWESGRRKITDLNRLAELEAAMGHSRGYVLRLAGYVEDAQTARQAIEHDPLLTPDHRRIVLNTYDGAAEESAADRSSRSTKRRPAVRKTRRS
jgi:transcriptional regulator with XRE-family HTH domain